MARPSKFDRNAAVEFAMNEIWRDGYEANSVKALSEKLGITRSSFYNAFGTREALFAEALELYLDRSPDRALCEVRPGMSVKRLLTETFRTACAARAADGEHRGCLAINSVTELCGTHTQLGHVMENMVLGNVERIEKLLQLAVTQKELRPDTDIHALALAVKNLLIGINVLCKVVHGEDELWKAAKVTLKGLQLMADEHPAPVQR